MFKFLLLITFTVIAGNGQNSNQGNSVWYDSKIYTFAFPAIAPGSRFNGTHVFGPRVDLMKEVCCRAKKRCQATLVDFIRCWNNYNQSEVLNGRWYDVCMQLSTIARRTVSYAFSDISFLTVPNPAVVVRKSSNITVADLQNPRNKLKLAFMAVPELGTSDVINVYREKFFIEPENVIKLERGAGNDVTSEILRLINDPCSGVDLGIVVTALARQEDPFKILADLPVDLGKSTIMVRMDDQHILEWWDYHLKKLMCSPKYKKFCHKLDAKFGKDPLNCPSAKQLNCKEDCNMEMRVPVCGCPDEPSEEPPTTEEPITTDKPLTTEPITTQKPLTTQPITTKEPLTTEPSSTDKPLTSQPTTEYTEPSTMSVNGETTEAPGGNNPVTTANEPQTTTPPHTINIIKTSTQPSASPSTTPPVSGKHKEVTAKATASANAG